MGKGCTTTRFPTGQDQSASRPASGRAPTSVRSNRQSLASLGPLNETANREGSVTLEDPGVVPPGDHHPRKAPPYLVPASDNHPTASMAVEAPLALTLTAKQTALTSLYSLRIPLSRKPSSRPQKAQVNAVNLWANEVAMFPPLKA
ncbi:uncharacterized protein DNG_01868 [Cephalotrichum gorgonifer]|uniref:Uncharacterized protein n=1 Tax=Cephalotrichum gorgonifer TaxID=2041049 RepID=A0AAE8MU32_9PEZI|nr:uncharacterized protein DNG_01868 [Cephalotrichum gorgonifer]